MKAPGILKGSEQYCEYIMFTSDEKLINKIDQNDWVNSLKLAETEEIIENVSQ